MKLRFVLLFALLLLSGIAIPALENTTDPEHPFAKHITSIYIRYLDALMEEDVVSALDKMIAKYSDMSTVITHELKKDMSANELDPLESRFIQVDTAKNTARIIYTKDIEDIKSWQAVIFKT